MKVAIETEGSFKNKNKVLLQKPNDFENLFKHINKNSINFNLNLGHLNLAASAFKFSKKDFIKLISDRVVALEISHNNGIIDQHKPLIESSSCLIYLKKFKNKKIFKILEFRDASMTDVKESIRILGNQIT